MLQPIILAAGRGTRMQSDVPKALHTLEGKPLVQWVTEAVEKSGVCATPIIVVGFNAPMVQEVLGSAYTYVLQTELSGTATAVKHALPHLSADVPALVLYCDQPFIKPETIVQADKLFSNSQAPALVIGTARVPDFENWRSCFMRFGRIVRGADNVPERIVEFKEATEQERAITEVNAGVYVADTTWLTDAINRIEPAPISGEFYLTELVQLARADNKHIDVVRQSPEEAFGINSQDERAQATLFTASAMQMA